MFPELVSERGLAQSLNHNTYLDRKSAIQSTFASGQFRSVNLGDLDEKAKFRGFDSEWPEHVLALTSIRCNFPTLNPAMVQKVYSRLPAPALVHEILKIGFADMYQADEAGKEMDRIWLEGRRQ